jgi:hypothetical protein
MALHRDIFWVGRQWAVTGYGMQAVDQKQKSKFDIEVSRLWDDDLLDGLSVERWFNLEDFSEGLSIARKRYPEPPRTARPAPPATVSLLKQSAPVPPSKPQPRSEAPRPVPEAKPAKPIVAKFAMRMEGLGAKFAPMWRIRIKR